MRKELEPKCVPQLCLGSLLGRRQSAIGQFFSPVPSNNPESQLGSVYFSFLKWQIIRYVWVLAWSPNDVSKVCRIATIPWLRFNDFMDVKFLFVCLFIYFLILNYNWLTFPFKVADQQAAVFGQCCFDVGDVNCTMGTGSFIDINTGSYPHASVAGNSKLRNLLFTGLQLLRWPPHGFFDLRYVLI